MKEMLKFKTGKDGEIGGSILISQSRNSVKSYRVLITLHSI